MTAPRIPLLAIGLVLIGLGWALSLGAPAFADQLGDVWRVLWILGFPLMLAGWLVVPGEPTRKALVIIPVLAPAWIIWVPILGPLSFLLLLGGWLVLRRRPLVSAASATIVLGAAIAVIQLTAIRPDVFEVWLRGSIMLASVVLAACVGLALHRERDRRLERRRAVLAQRLPSSAA